MPTIVVGMWEVRADLEHGHASMAMAPAINCKTEEYSGRENGVRSTEYGRNKKEGQESRERD
jgi:hypothetical protein